MDTIASWAEMLKQHGFGGNRISPTNGGALTHISECGILEIYSGDGMYTRVVARSHPSKYRPYEFVQYRSANSEYPKTEFFAGKCKVSYVGVKKVASALNALVDRQKNKIPPSGGWHSSLFRAKRAKRRSKPPRHLA